MAFEMLVGLDVTHRERYKEYRAAMGPILDRYGGGFRYDFEIAEVLRAPVSETINRVFTIFFPDRGAMDAFFSDPQYLEVKEELFEASVAATTILASYER